MIAEELKALLWVFLWFKRFLRNIDTPSLFVFKNDIKSLKNDSCEGISLKKYENKSNVCGNLIKTYREKRHLTKAQLSRLLQLHAVYLDSTELFRIENGKMIVKDFELIALCFVLDIDFEGLKDLIE